MARPKVHDEALRVRLLDEAGRLLSEEGPAVLSLRTLAKHVGTSTTAVYSLFGSKSALVRAVFLEGFARFGARLAAVPRSDDPITDLLRLGVAYRESAMADPHLYSIMFGPAVPDFEPEPEDTEASQATMKPLLEAVRAARDADLLTDTPAETIAIALWAHAHGLVSLELAAAMPEDFDVESHYQGMLAAALRGWLRNPPTQEN
ncbi:MAG TPA: TetR/AcrR family transcriptional regulator [Pseudonocardiaceae bacterium]|nr:TetR/AcrR family transcriptional regulator [Pseudonocardiaceae bacterium]